MIDVFAVRCGEAEPESDEGEWVWSDADDG